MSVKKNAMKSLLGHYDSGSGSEDEVEDHSEEAVEMEEPLDAVDQLQQENKNHDRDRDRDHDSDQYSDSEGEDTDMDKITDPVEFHRMLVGKKPEEIKIPKASRDDVDPLILEKMMRLKEKKDSLGLDMKLQIQKRKDFRNPSIYEKLIDHCGIEEFGSNFPPETFDPKGFETESFYEKLSLSQKVLMDSIAKEVVASSTSSSISSSTARVEIITGTAKKPAPTSTSTASSSQETKRRRHSKWDEGPSTKFKVEK